MPINDCPFESSFEPSGNYSSCPVYEIDDGERLVAVPYPEFYRCRGKELDYLSRWDYISLIQTVPISNDDDANQADIAPVDTCNSNCTESTNNDQPMLTKKGRKKGKRFPFGEGMILRATHVQKLRQKWCVPKFFKILLLTQEYNRWRMTMTLPRNRSCRGEERPIGLLNITWFSSDQKKEHTATHK